MLRPCTPSDQAALLEARHAVKLAEVATWGLPPGLVVPMARTQAEAHHRALQEHDCYIAERGGAPAAAIYLAPLPDGGALLVDLMVWPERQRQGLGGEILAHLQATRPSLRLTVAQDKPWLVEWYARLGFTLVEGAQGPHLSMIWRASPRPSAQEA